MTREYTQADLDEYLKNDVILEDLRRYSGDADFSSHKWLEKIPAKRMIYHDVYGELFGTRNKRVLDIGGGFWGKSRELIQNHDYTLVDIMTRDSHEKLRSIERELGKFWDSGDWYDFNIDGEYDYIVANDIFPNVDQRLGKFLQKFRPYARKMILTLTCYDRQSMIDTLFEKMVQRLHSIAGRVDADKVVFVRAPGTDATNAILKEELRDSAPVLPQSGNPSIFSNGRKVYKVELQ